MIGKKRYLKLAVVSTALAVFLGENNALQAQAERVLGLDVSYWNRGSSSPTANGITQTAWNTAYNTPNANGYTRSFVWVRASRGGTTGLSEGSGTPNNPSPADETLSRRYDDPELLRTMTRATTAGFFAGPYHYGRQDVAGNTGADEADHFIEYASAYMRPGYLIPVFDLEDGSGSDALAQFCIDFSNRLYERMQIRPAMYINGNYSSILQGATSSRRDQLAKPATVEPSVVGPAYPMLWNARYYNQTNGFNPETIPVQTGTPKTHPSLLTSYYGPWDDYGDLNPWSFWQYASVVSIPGINTVDGNVDGNVSHGDIEYVKNYLVPALWWNDTSGDWSTLTNWNSGQPLSTFNGSDLNNPPAPYTPHVGAGQTTPFTSYTLPSPRLPGASGSGATSGQHDTVILDRPNANVTVTVSTGTHNVRKLYMRETINITGGSLTVNYDPTYRDDDSADVLHGGPISAQFSGPVTVSGGTFNVHTLQVDTNRTFTLSGGTLGLNTIKLMPNSSSPARIVVSGNVTMNALSNAAAVVVKGSGSGSSGYIDLAAANRSVTIGNGTADVDLSIDVPVTNGGLIKAGSGTLRLSSANTYVGGTTISAGRLIVSNSTGSGTGTGAVLINGGILSGTGIVSGAVSLNSGGTIAPGNTSSFGTLTLGSAQLLNGTNLLRIDRVGSPLSDKIVVSSGTLNYGGTLVLTNAGAALTGGETFALYSAPSYSGAFSGTNLPALNAGLNWYLGSLVTNGTIKVNRQPVANTETFTNTPTQVLQIPLASLLTNDTDADSDTLVISSISLVTTNGVMLTTNSTHIFYSNNVSVADQFTYTITDRRGATATANVRILPSAFGWFSSAATYSGNTITLHVSGRPGSTYFTERSTNLPVWFTIKTNVAPGNGIFDVIDTFTNGRPPEAYYRLRWPAE